MADVTVGIIGTGDPEGSGAAMAYNHARSYERHGDCTLVACADLVRENAEQFADEFGVPDEQIYENYEEMLAACEPDIVSVCTPVPAHDDIVIGAATTGNVGAIHCEKPMADTWGGAREMARVCEDAGVQLTFNHQRRFGRPWRRAKELLDSGRIGRLQRLETATGSLLDSGTHRIDLCNYFNDGRDVEWVMGQLDYTTENVQFGAHNENQAVGFWVYENGVHGLAIGGQGSDTVGCFSRLVGSEGVIEVRRDEPVLRVRHADSTGWTAVDCDGEGIHESVNIDRTITEVVEAFDEGRESEIGPENALRATEIIFAVRESARRRGRVELPLRIDDDPLEAMVDAGDLSPTPQRE